MLMINLPTIPKKFRSTRERFSRFPMRPVNGGRPGKLTVLAVVSRQHLDGKKTGAS
jgi:hypothetical protein